MTKGIVAQINTPALASGGSHITFQATYGDAAGDAATTNFNLALGLTGELTNIAIGSAIASDCNTRFGTIYTYLDVVLIGAADFL
jgi:hypothetical protein